MHDFLKLNTRCVAIGVVRGVLKNQGDYCGVEPIKLIRQHFSHNRAVPAEPGPLPSQRYLNLARR